MKSSDYKLIMAQYGKKILLIGGDKPADFSTYNIGSLIENNNFMLPEFHTVTNAYAEELSLIKDWVTIHHGEMNEIEFWRSLFQDKNLRFDVILFDKSTVKFAALTLEILHCIAALLKENGKLYIENSGNGMVFFNIYGHEKENQNAFGKLIKKVFENDFGELFKCLFKFPKEVTVLGDLPILLGRNLTNYKLIDKEHVVMAYDELMDEMQGLGLNDFTIMYEKIIEECRQTFQFTIDQYNEMMFCKLFKKVEFSEGSYLDSNEYRIKSYFVLSGNRDCNFFLQDDTFALWSEISMKNNLINFNEAFNKKCHYIGI
jgi:hypothetical protein